MYNYPLTIALLKKLNFEEELHNEEFIADNFYKKYNNTEYSISIEKNISDFQKSKITIRIFTFNILNEKNTFGKHDDIYCYEFLKQEFKIELRKNKIETLIQTL